MSITSKYRIISYVLAIYFFASCTIILYLTYYDFSTFLNIYSWQYNRSHVKEYLFSNVNHRRWLHLQNKFSGFDLNILWNEHLAYNHTKTLIYRCESFCGGLGDRLRGIISSYFLALFLQRKFMIYMPYPCEITNFLRPNMYNWIYQDLNNKSIRTKKVIQAIDKVEILSELNQSLFINEWAKYDDIVVYTNLDLLTVIFSNIAMKQNPIVKMFLQQMLPEEGNFQTLFCLLFEILFKPTGKVIDLIDPILERVASSNDSLLCLHIRVGKNPSNPKDELLEDRNDITDGMIAFLKEHIIPKQRKLLILIASDSNASISKVQHHFPNQTITVQGPILHLDRPSEITNVDQGCVAVLATFYILGECQSSLLTNSGFSALANRRRIRPYANLYKYNFKKKQIERCEDVVSTSRWEPKRSAEFVLYCPVVVNLTVQES